MSESAALRLEAAPAMLALTDAPAIGRVHATARHSYWVVPAQAEHVRLLLPRLRSADVAEIAGTANSPARALWRGYRNSILAETAFVDGEIAAMWGLCVGFSPGVSLLSDLGRPWLLTAPAVERVPFAVVREARRATLRMLACKPRLENYVLASYTAAVRMLELIGYNVDPPAAVGLGGTLYRRFHRER